MEFKLKWHIIILICAILNNMFVEAQENPDKEVSFMRHRNRRNFLDTSHEKKLIKRNVDNNLCSCMDSRDQINSIITKFESLESNTNTAINVLVEQIALLTTIIKQLTDTSEKQLQSLETVNHRLIALEEISKLEETNLHKLLDITKNIQESSKQSIHELEELVSDSGDSHKDASVMDTLCKGKLPNIVKFNYGAWKEKEVPVEDNLDRFMTTKTGCSYAAVAFGQNFPLPAAYYNGNSFEWHASVRGYEEGTMEMGWGSTGFNIYIGQESNTKMSLDEFHTGRYWKAPTPKFLSPERYVPVYMKIHNGTISVGSDCESQPYLSQPVKISRGEIINRSFKSWSQKGSKYLLNCPSNTIG